AAWACAMSDGFLMVLPYDRVSGRAPASTQRSISPGLATSKAAPASTSARTTAGWGFAFTAYCTRASGKASVNLEYRSITVSISTTRHGVGGRWWSKKARIRSTVVLTPSRVEVGRGGLRGGTPAVSETGTNGFITPFS